MTIKQIYALALKMGLAADPRGPQGVKRYLNSIKKHYESLSAEDKKYFDQNKLTDPYADSDIHLSPGGESEIKTILAGIDMGVPEILLGAELQERGTRIDLLLGHHPIGRTLAELSEVMDLQVDVFAGYGVPMHVAENLMHERMSEVSRNIKADNHYREVDAARLLGFNLMNIHTLTDNLVKKYVKNFLKKENPETVGEILKTLLEIPEYAEAKRRGAGPYLISGRPQNRVGKLMIDMTGGASPSDKIYQELSQAGVSTIVGMHMNEKSFAEAKNAFLNIIIAGHIASDSLGMNLFLDELEKKGIKIIPCSGLIRISRVSRVGRVGK